jgi:hypothetical protein
MPARVTCPDCSTSTGSRLTRQQPRRRDLWVIGSAVTAGALFVAFAGTALVLSLDEAATSLATMLPAPPPALPPVVDADLPELLDKFPAATAPRAPGRRRREPAAAGGRRQKNPDLPYPSERLPPG